MTTAGIGYAALVVAVALVIRLVPRAGVQKLALVAASIGFYATWGLPQTALLVVLAAAAWGAGVAVERREAQGSRRAIVGAFVAFALGVLGVFKYYGFFAGSLAALTGADPSRPGPLLALGVPAGISFIVFQTISYVVDVYRGTERARSALDVGLLVGFFPHLVAGPLLRSREFLAQFDEPVRPGWSGVESGVSRFVLGAVKKVVIADSLGVFVDRVYETPALWSTATVWLAVLAYAFQILFDFSGYTDMAIGSARVLGVRLPENFDWPYLVRDVTAFWRHWHITLSNWLRDYLYIPLGGSRRGELRQAVNLLIVMGLGGLWHGASWTFVIWGLAHGMALVVHKLWRAWRDENVAPALTGWRGYAFLAWALTFGFVVLAWIPFRAVDASQAIAVVARLGGAGSAGMSWVPPVVPALAVVLACAVALRMRGFEFRAPRLLSFSGAFVLTLALALLFFGAPVASTPFVYAGF